MKDKLEEARKEINGIDREMAELFVRRMRASEAVAEYKSAHGLEILDPQREDEVIRRNSSLIEDDRLRAYYVNFLKNTMAVSRSYQSELIKGMRVAFSGTEGAFAHIASKKLFPTATYFPFPDFESAYKAVENGECDVAVLPVENSYNGEVGQVTDLMMSGSLYVNNMIELAVTQDLVATEGAVIGDIRRVISHPQALGQCKEFIAEHGFTPIEFSNTALAAREVAERGDKSLGAICSKEAAEIYGLKVLQANINSSRSNTTRFAVFSRSENTHRSREMGVHSVLVFTVRNEAGALARAIDIIGKHGFNMRTLRSRPMKELLWQYYFYIEAEGNLNTDEGIKMMAELRGVCDRLKAVGTYVKKD